MDNFAVIYRILTAFEKSMDEIKFDMKSIQPEVFGITTERWIKILIMLIDSGYIKGITIDIAADGHPMISIYSPQITLAGLEYLQENSVMRKVSNALKSGIEVAGSIF